MIEGGGSVPVVAGMHGWRIRAGNGNHRFYREVNNGAGRDRRGPGRGLGGDFAACAGWIQCP